MTPSKHPYYYSHHHHRTDNFGTTPSPPSSLLPPRRTRPPSLSLLQFSIHDGLLGRRVSDASANPEPNAPNINTNAKAGNDKNGEDEGDSSIPIRSRNASTCSHRSSNRSRSNLLLSDSEISVLDLGPSLGREVDGALGSCRSGSRAASLPVPGVRVGVSRRLCSSSSGGDGLAGPSHDAGDAGDGEKKGRYMDVEGRECDYGYGYGYEIDDDDDEGAVGQRPVLLLPCDGDGVDSNDAHGDHDGHAPAPAQGREHDNEHEHGTISSPLLVPLKTTRKAKRGGSWSKAFGSEVFTTYYV